ncbi:MAG TPA: hypothetical protein VKV15_03900 [Bryobacteraceae bacterium]|nr:hypothetical protein [Bryobacteraceae bacterium]
MIAIQRQIDSFQVATKSDRGFSHRHNFNLQRMATESLETSGRKPLNGLVDSYRKRNGALGA